MIFHRQKPFIMSIPHTGAGPAGHHDPRVAPWTPDRLVNEALSKLYLAGRGMQFHPDPIVLLHMEHRTVQKDCVTVDNVEFYSEALRPWTGKTVEVRFDAAAADRGDLHEVVVRLVIDGKVTNVHCPPRATMQDILDRDAVRRNRMAYRDALREQRDQAEAGSARRFGGAAAGKRQGELQRKRRAQGRPGQDHSGLGPARPEVEQGVRDHQDQVLRRKAKNRGILNKDEPKKTSRSGPSSRQSKQSSSRQRAKAAGANPWQDMAADSGAAPSKGRRRTA